MVLVVSDNPYAARSVCPPTADNLSLGRYTFRRASFSISRAPALTGTVYGRLPEMLQSSFRLDAQRAKHAFYGVEFREFCFNRVLGFFRFL